MLLLRLYKSIDEVKMRNVDYENKQLEIVILLSAVFIILLGGIVTLIKVLCMMATIILWFVGFILSFHYFWTNKVMRLM